MAIQTVIGFDRWWIISLAVKNRGKFKDLLGAILDAIATSFAAVIDNMDNTLGNVNVINIKWNSPEFHDPFLIYFCD
jgi:hypothetical protein